MCGVCTGVPTLLREDKPNPTGANTRYNTVACNSHRMHATGPYKTSLTASSVQQALYVLQASPCTFCFTNADRNKARFYHSGLFKIPETLQDLG